MSRTLKDRPAKIRFTDETVKKPKNVDTKWHWMEEAPSWWVNLFMTRPQRHEAQRWERDVQKVQDLEELEDIDKPNVSNKPHKYYW